MRYRIGKSALLVAGILSMTACSRDKSNNKPIEVEKPNQIDNSTPPKTGGEGKGATEPTDPVVDQGPSAPDEGSPGDDREVILPEVNSCNLGNLEINGKFLIASSEN